MRQGSSGRRSRGRSGSGGGGGGGRKNVPQKNQNFDSNGPDVRVRGNAHQVYEKYLALARDASSAGDRVIAESYYQHAEHYYRIINENTDPVAERDFADGADDDGRDERGYYDDGDGDDRGSRQERRQRYEQDERAQRPPRAAGNGQDDRSTSGGNDQPAGTGEQPDTPAQGAAGADQTPAKPKRGRPKKLRPDGYGRMQGDDGGSSPDPSAAGAEMAAPSGPATSESGGQGDGGGEEAAKPKRGRGRPRKAKSGSNGAGDGSDDQSAGDDNARDDDARSSTPNGAATDSGDDGQPNF